MFARITRLSLVAFAAVSLLASCKKEDDVAPAEPGPVTLFFDNVVGGSDLVLNTTEYTNPAGEAFKVSLLQYYITNISLKKADGTMYVVAKDSSNFLVREDNAASQNINLKNIPAGNYTSVTFNVGVDSVTSRTEPASRTGVLNISDAATGQSMYWSWNPGYIFYRLEGTSPAVMADDKMFVRHIGGYGGTPTSRTLNNNRVITLNLPTAAEVKKGRKPEVHILHDVLKALNGPGGMQSFALVAQQHSINDNARKVADNYTQAFIAHHVHND